jgi:hypothetical protein
LEEPSSNPHPRQLPNKFKMSKLGPKNLFKKTKKKNHPTLDWKASSHGKGYTPRSLEV